MKAGGKAPVSSQKCIAFFIVLTVGLENNFKGKQINVYWAVKAPPSQRNNVLADRM